MNETKLEVLTNLSVSDVHCIQTMIEFFEVRIRDDDEDMYRALCLTTARNAKVSHEDMEYIADYLSDMYKELDNVDDVSNECNAIITLEQHYTAYDKNSYRRIDNGYESRKQFEERLLTNMLQEISTEPLCNILSYAASYLRSNLPDYPGTAADQRTASILDKYATMLEARITEVR